MAIWHWAKVGSMHPHPHPLSRINDDKLNIVCYGNKEANRGN